MKSVIELSELGKILYIFDHGELLCNEPEEYGEIIKLLNQIGKRSKFLFTSRVRPTIGFDIKSYQLSMPTKDEVISMLKYYIKTESKWLFKLVDIIGYHPFVIKTIGISCHGEYLSETELITKAKTAIQQPDEVQKYFKELILSMDQRVRSWLYIAFLCNGAIFKKIIPINDLERINNFGLILDEEKNCNNEYITFHPIVISSVENIVNKKEAAKVVLNILDKISLTTYSTFYKYICYCRLKDKKANDFLIDYWQEWTEILGSSQGQAIIQEKWGDFPDINILDLFFGIIQIYRGSHDELIQAAKTFFDIHKNRDTFKELRTLALLEYIECIRKIYGPRRGINLLLKNVDIINEGILDADRNSKINNIEQYCLGTIYFLIGNILRSAESYSEAINFYNHCLIFFGDKSVGNAALQRMHAYYGISVCRLRQGLADVAIATIDHYLRQGNIISDFGLALMLLSKGKAQLIDSDIDEGMSSILKATNLFKELGLAYYYERCQLIMGVLEHLDGNNENAQIILSNLIERSDGTKALDIRAKTLMYYLENEIPSNFQSIIEKIEEHCGKKIALTYQHLLSENNFLINPQELSMNSIHFRNGKIIIHKKENIADRKIPKKVKNIPWLID